MAARARANGRAPAAAAKRKRERQAKYDDELRVAAGHLENVQARRRQLQEQRDAIDVQLAELRDVAAQLRGRVGVLQELRGEAPPLRGFDVPAVGAGEPTPEPVDDAGPGGNDPAPA